jgi:heptosyltransferase II
VTLRVCIANPAFIGDVLFSSRLCDALSRQYPEVQILFLAKPPAQQLAQHFPGVTQAVAFEKRGAHRGLAGVRAMAHIINDFKPELFINTHRGWRMAYLTSLLKSKTRKVGFKGFWQFLLDDAVNYDAKETFFAREARLLHAIDVSDGDSHMRCGLNTDAVGNEIILAPGANFGTKRWPVSSYIQLAQAFIADKFSVVLTGGPYEQELCASIHTAVPQCVNRCGESLEEAKTHMAQAALVVANDSGLAHLARAVQSPTLMIFGPTPWRVHELEQEAHVLPVFNSIECSPCSAHGHAKCPQGHHQCMTDLSAKDVYAKAKVLLDI